MATDRHMEAAGAVYWSIMDLEPFTRRSIEAIAAALAKAEREGMERAAEIVQRQFDRAIACNLAARRVGDQETASRYSWESTATQIIHEMIISQAGEIA